MGPQPGAHRERPRPGPGRDPRRVRQGQRLRPERHAAPRSATELDFVADRVSVRLPWMRVTAQHRGGLPGAPELPRPPEPPQLPWGCADVLAQQERGEDPTASWREEFAQQAARQYGRPAPAHVGATFVLQWYVDVVAYPAAFAASLGPWVLDVSPEALRFALHPQLYPDAVALGGADPVAVPDPRERHELARRAYLGHAERFAASYRPGVKMSSRQRFGAVRDTWAAAAREAALACTRPPHPEPAWRESCCFIVALPGTTACLTCPRRRSPGDGAAPDAGAPLGVAASR